MKRILLLTIAVCLLLCSCGRGGALHRDRVPEWPFAMETSLELQADDLAITADWTYKDSASTFVIRQPQTLSGVTVICNAVECRIESGGVEADLPQQSAFVLLDRAYRALTDGLVEPKLTQEGWLYDGMDRYGFEALGTEEYHLQIRFPKANAEAVFTVTPTQTNIE